MDYNLQNEFEALLYLSNCYVIPGQNIYTKLTQKHIL